MCHAPNTRRALWLAKGVVVSILFARLPVLVAGDDTPSRPSPIAGAPDTKSATRGLVNNFENAMCAQLQKAFRAAARLGDFEKAEKLHWELVSISRKTRGANDWETVVQTHIAGCARRACQLSAAKRRRLAKAHALLARHSSLKSEGDPRGALRALCEAQRVYTEVMGEDINTSIMQLSMVGPLQKSLGLNKDAKVTFSKGIKLWCNLVQGDNFACASALNELGCVCLELKELEEAETYCTESVEMMRASADAELSDRLLAQYNLVRCYNARRKFQPAEALARHTMRMAGGPPPEVLGEHTQTHVQLALSLAGQKRFDEAFSDFEEVIDVYEAHKNATTPPTAAQWAELLDTYATALRAGGRDADAKAYFDKAARYQAKTAETQDGHPEANPATAGNDASAPPPGESAEFKAQLKTLKSRVNHYVARRDFHAELQARRALLSALRDKVGPANLNTIYLQEVTRCFERVCKLDAESQRRFIQARGLFEKATELMKDRNDRHALTLLRNAFQICREVTGDESIFTVSYLERLAEVQDRLGQLKDAKESYTLAIRAALKVTGDTDFDNAWRMQRLANHCIQLEDYEEAEEWLLRAKPAFQASSNVNLKKALIMALTFAQLYKSTGRFEQAESAIRATIQGTAALGPEGSALHAISLLELGPILAGQKKYAQAAVAYQRAERAYEALQYSQDTLSHWQKLFENYATTLRALGRNDQADAYAAKAARAATVQKMTAME